MNKVECSMCRKKKPHGHKGCNEHGLLRIQIGEPKKEMQKERGKR